MLEKLKNIYEKIINSIRPKKQIDTFNYEKLTQLMKEKGTFQEFENELNNFDEIAELMRNKTNLHGINHIVRVLFNAYAIITMEDVNEQNKKIIVEAAKLHDIGRKHDGEDEEHGNLSAIKARKILETKGFSTEEINAICFIIKEHSLPRYKNNEDIENLPAEIKERYQYCLNILKDADKLDRVRIGDLDLKRLTTDSAKRLVEVSKDVFENNRHYYQKKMKVYPIDEKNAEEILAQIKQVKPEIDIDLEEVKKNYSKYKSIQEQDKIEWLKAKEDNILLNDFIEIINTITEEDMEYLKDRFLVGKKTVIEAIHDMGINKFMQLKADKKLYKIFNIDNYGKNLKLTDKERELLLELRRYDYTEEVISQFYLYRNFIKKCDSNKFDMLLMNSKDKIQYLDNKTNDKSSGYKWSRKMLFTPAQFEMAAIKEMDTELFLKIREKSNIPLNIIITAMLHLDLFDENLQISDLEKILLNYYKFNLNEVGKIDIEQVKNVCLSIPEDLNTEYETLIKECIIGRFKRFNLENFEQIKNYKKICDKKILEEFDKKDDINELRKLIIETKFKDLEGAKRDVHFYEKYLGDKAKENKVISLFDNLLHSQDKEELLKAYKELNKISEEFDLDNKLNDVRQILSKISKEDAVKKMKSMKERIEKAQTKNIQGTEVIDLTGTDFNLLISVIGGAGSPYLVDYHNKVIHKERKFQNSRFFGLIRKKTDLELKIGIKRLINKRYKIDPLKNKQRCVSSIDQDFIGHIPSEIKGNKQNQDRLILAYFPQNIEDIYCMGNQDLMTIYDKDRKDNTRKRVPHADNLHGVCNLKLRDLNSTTKGEDNELIIDSYPGAVMCFDNISNITKKTAKRLNVPILYIDSKEQFKIMETKINDYYREIKEHISQNEQMSEETFQGMFNTLEQDNNVIHRAFKLANGFSFLNGKDYLQKQIIDIFNKMKILVDESLKRCNSTQREIIQSIMAQEADRGSLRYGRYDKFIDFGELNDLVLEKGSDEKTQFNR